MHAADGDVAPAAPAAPAAFSTIAIVAAATKVAAEKEEDVLVTHVGPNQLDEQEVKPLWKFFVE